MRFAVSEMRLSEGWTPVRFNAQSDVKISEIYCGFD